MRTVAPLLVLCLACAGDAADHPGVLVRDSAGVRIVESSSPVWSGGPGWRLTEEPDVRIGHAQGMPEYELYRVGGVARLSDGRIAVVNSGSEQVRVFGFDGRYLAFFGGEGEGPGEFRGPRFLWVLPGDSMLIADLDRFSVFDRDYRFVRTEPFGNRMPQQRLSDGSFVGLGFAAGEDFLKLGRVRPLYAVVRTRPDDSRDTLAVVPGDDIFRIERNGGISQWLPPFGLNRRLVTRAMSLYTGDGSAFEVAVLDTAGHLTRIMRRPDVDRSIRDGMVDRWREIQLGPSPTAVREEAIRTIIREAGIPGRHPAWNALVVDALGNVWIEHYALDREAPSVWTVFDPDGAWLGEVRTPPAVDVREIGADYLLGIRTDSLGIEFVESYGLIKG